MDPVTSATILLVTESDVSALIAAEEALVEARTQRLKSESALLHSMLPPAVVPRVLAGEVGIAEAHPHVCVLFADVVGAPRQQCLLKGGGGAPPSPCQATQPPPQASPPSVARTHQRW